MFMCSQDLVIVQTISLLANTYDCVVTDVNMNFDIEKGYWVGQIEIWGPQEKKAKLAMAIDEILKKFDLNSIEKIKDFSTK